jgi:aminomethyltransferase
MRLRQLVTSVTKCLFPSSQLKISFNHHARKFLDRVCTRQILGMEKGQVRYSLVCNERGGVRDDVLVYCYDEDDYMMVVNASNRLKILDWFRSVKERENMTFQMEDVTADTAMAAIQGPKVMELVGGFSREIPTLKRYRFAEKSLMVAKLTVSRTGYTGEDGVELVVPAAAAEAVWSAIHSAGTPHGLRACGLGARDTLRLEAGLCLYGHDIDEKTSPVEAGLTWRIDQHEADLAGL